MIRQPGYAVAVDLRTEEIELPDGRRLDFSVDPFRRDCLLRGLDDIGLTLEAADAIRAYETRRRVEAPWLFQDMLE